MHVVGTGLNEAHGSFFVFFVFFFGACFFLPGLFINDLPAWISP